RPVGIRGEVLLVEAERAPLVALQTAGLPDVVEEQRQRRQLVGREVLVDGLVVLAAPVVVVAGAEVGLGLPARLARHRLRRGAARKEEGEANGKDRPGCHRSRAPARAGIWVSWA